LVEKINKIFWLKKKKNHNGMTFTSGAGYMGSNSEPIKSRTSCQQLATVAVFEMWTLAQAAKMAPVSLTPKTR